MSRVKAEHSFIVHKPLSELIMYFKRVDKFGEMYSVESVDSNENVIKLKRKLNIWTVGEQIYMKLSDKSAEDDIATEVYVKSEPVLPTAIFDYGVNKRNCQRIETAIKLLSEDERDYVERARDSEQEARDSFEEAKTQAKERILGKWTLRKEAKEAKKKEK